MSERDEERIGSGQEEQEATPPATEDKDEVQEQSEESFPASDPPSY